MKQLIPIFFAVDNNYMPFLSVALCSLIANASKDYDYKILVLNSNVTENNIGKIKELENDNFIIEFVNVNEKIENIVDDLSLRLRDYYSNSIYYRLFIASLFPDFDKALYLDADIAVIGDISKLYFEELGDNLVGAITDEVVNANDTFVKYAKVAIGIEAEKYFNSGILVMNLAEFRKEKIEEKFVHLLSKYNFNVVAPDQDYLNYLCKGKVKYIHKGWDKMALIEDKDFDESTLQLIHYNMFQKPWNYSGVPYEEYFWKYAKESNYYDEIVNMQSLYTDERKMRDELGGINLINSAASIIKDEANTFNNVIDESYFDNFVI